MGLIFRLTPFPHKIKILLIAGFAGSSNFEFHIGNSVNLKIALFNLETEKITWMLSSLHRRIPWSQSCLTDRKTYQTWMHDAS